MPRNPVKQVEVGKAHYAIRLPDMDSAHFGCVWHFYTLGHLIQTDLDRVARTLGLSFADLEFLGMLPIEPREAPRATDIAAALYVSTAAVSTRVVRLARLGLIQRSPAADDRRAHVLTLTTQGRALIDEAIRLVTRDADIVRFFGRLNEADQRALTRILGILHEDYDRGFVGTVRQE